MQADISGWWDTQHRILGPILNGFISDHPDWFGVVAAAGTVLPPESRAGSVDLLRFGPDGTRRHTRNLTRDGLPLLQVGPRNEKPGKLRLRRVIVRPSSGFLAWANAGEALRVGGAKAFAQALAIRGQAIPPPGTRQHVLSGGDDLCSLASTYYGSESKWPLIEEANGVLAKGRPCS